MPTTKIRARREVSRKIGLGIIILVGTAALLLTSTLLLFVNLNERQSSVQASIREDAVWAAYQADREASRLVESLAANADDVAMRYDLLYSRIDLVESGSFAIPFGEESEVGPLAKAVGQRVRDMLPYMDALASNIERTELLERAQAIRAATGALLVVANGEVNSLRVTERRRSLETYWQIGASVAAFAVTLITIVTLLAVQLRQISQSQGELKVLSQRHERAAREAQAANRAKSAFLATMSHEIRTPLNGIIGMTEIMSSTPLDAAQLKNLDVIRHSGEILLDLITDILDYSKLEAGAVTVVAAPFALADMIGSVETVMRSRAEAAGLSITFDRPNWSVTTDANRLRQVLLNLVGNAIKFTPTGGIEVKMVIEEGSLSVSVTDTGLGIAETDLPRLFKDFSQLDSSSTRAFGGTGLGLAICKRLIGAMNGTIGVESQVGVGSRFWFKIPVAPAEILDGTSDPAAAEPCNTGLGARVLIVDDNAINRSVAAGILRSMGARSEQASSGAEALSILHHESFDLVLMDMQMPELDGMTATKLLRASGSTVRIVGLTANAFEADRSACLEAGMDDYFAKPVSRQKLIQALGQIQNPDVLSIEKGLVIDKEYQSMLEAEFGKSEFARLVEQFNVDAKALVNQFELAASLGKSDEVDAALHTLKGIALTLGFTSISEFAQDARTKASAYAEIATQMRGMLQIIEARISSATELLTVN